MFEASNGLAVSDAELFATGEELSLDFEAQNAPVARPSKGSWFDPGIDLKAPAGGALTVHALLEIAKNEKRSRKRKMAAQSNHFYLVRAILANGMQCCLYRQNPWVAYFRKADGYQSDVSWLSGKALSRTIDLMEEAGLLEGYVGGPGRGSLYRLTPGVVEVARQWRITEKSITQRHQPSRLLRLFSPKPERKPLVIEKTSETVEWTRELEDINSFLSEQAIGHEIAPEEVQRWLLERNKKGKYAALRLPELFRTGLYRVFSNGSLAEGGRLYGGWWINCPKELRSKITINGQPTVELDFSSCFPRMLYQERGLECPADPYELEPVTEFALERGLSPGFYRTTHKRLFNAMVNSGKKGRPANILREYALPYPECFTPSQMRGMLEAKHALIADAFGSGEGLRLQRTESDIALAILAAMRKKDVVVLPVHDSFRTTKQDEELLRQSMINEYRKRLSFEPLISIAY